MGGGSTDTAARHTGKCHSRKFGVVPSHTVERTRGICVRFAAPCPERSEEVLRPLATPSHGLGGRRRGNTGVQRIGSHGPVAGARAGGPVPEARERKSRWPVRQTGKTCSGAMAGILFESNLVLPVFRPKGPLAHFYEATPMIGQQTAVNTQFPSSAQKPDSSARARHRKIGRSNPRLGLI